MIIFGSRMYGKKHRVDHWHFCEHCQRISSSRSYTSRRWGHLYFIPLIPLGFRARVVKECVACNLGVHVVESELESFRETNRKMCEQALAAIGEGRETFVDEDGQQYNALEVLVAAVEWLMCVHEEAFVKYLLQVLHAGESPYAFYTVNGAVHTLQGKFEEAIHSCKAALAEYPENPQPLLSMGIIYYSQHQYELAEVVFEEALEMAEDEPEARRVMLQWLLYVAQAKGDNERMAQLYESLFREYPEIQNDGQVIKAYKKVCKKVKRRPVLG